MSVRLYPGDNRESLLDMRERGELVDGVVTDPPYGFISITKRFGGKDAKVAQHGRDGAYQRVSGGFMGKAWDATGIERDPEFWGLLLDVMKPGAFCMAFSGAHSAHWQGVAMEQAGFIMHPMIAWVYSSGFPKAHDAARAFDKAAGFVPLEIDGEIIPMSEDGEKWVGWKYGTQSLKPAMEPILVGQKPLSAKTYVENMRREGVGGLNIEANLIPFVDDEDRNSARPAGRATSGAIAGKADLPERDRKDFAVKQRDGRYPANVLHDGTESVKELFPVVDSAGNRADKFFGSHRFEETDLPPVLYCGKATKADRAGSTHPTVKPVALLRHLIRLTVPKGGTILDPFAGSGTTAAAALEEGCSAIIMEQDEAYATFLATRFETLTTQTDTRQNAAPKCPKSYISDLIG